MLCAVHQPNFFPWLGYFDKIRRADVFVFLDNVDYPKSGSGLGSWVNRVKIDVKGEAAWWGARIVREHGPQKINSVMLDDDVGWREKALRTLEQSYARAPHAAQVAKLAKRLLNDPERNLAAFNIRAIQAIAEVLGVSSRFVRQSELNVSGAATELLVNICKAVGADAYLEGMGATGYQDDGLFAANGIALVKQDFRPRPYRERFLAGLSALDFLMHAEPGGAHDPFEAG